MMANYNDSLNQALSAVNNSAATSDVLAQTEKLLTQQNMQELQYANSTATFNSSSVSSGDENTEKDPGDISNIKNIYEAMYKKVNVFLNAMLTSQGYSYSFVKAYKRYKMEYSPDATLLKEMLKNKVRLVLPDDLV